MVTIQRSPKQNQGRTERYMKHMVTDLNDPNEMVMFSKYTFRTHSKGQ